MNKTTSGQINLVEICREYMRMTTGSKCFIEYLQQKIYFQVSVIKIGVTYR